MIAIFPYNSSKNANLGSEKKTNKAPLKAVYYYNLLQNEDSEPERKINKAFAILKTIERSFHWFTRYLDNSIEALKRKEDIKAKWKKLNFSEHIAYLKIVGNLFEIPKKILLKVDKNQVEGLKIEDQIMGSSCPHRVIYIGNGEIEIEPAPEEEEVLYYRKKKIDYSIIPPLLPNGKIISETDTKYIVYCPDEKSINNAQKLSEKKIVPFIDFENLKIEENGEKLICVREEGLTIKIENDKYYGKKISSNNIFFTLERINKANKHSYWIQLLEEEEEEEDIPGFSKLKYFFDDDVTIEDDNKNRYKVVDGIESENRIILKKENSNEYCFPPENSKLRIKINTYVLRKQMEAVKTITSMPLVYHKKLLELFEKKEKVVWDNFSFKEILEWYVLTEEDRDGCREQREFVIKATSTPDFAILEGPPGSGKTTVILELICQIVKKGGRILLCGSTHVAIDNVLERLKEKRKDGSSLIEKLNILPVRIGDEKRVSEDIKEFQIDNLVKDKNISEDFLLDISNLVCGTTIGILQNPKFKNRDSKTEPIVPEFDYLIIDEASKTRFQEFLVPALYAKKWILIGDIKQLSPFTDMEEIVYNIENIDEKLNSEYQLSLLLLNKLEDYLREKNRFILPVSSNIINYMANELIKGKMANNIISIIVVSEKEIKRENINRNNLFFYTKDNIEFLKLTASDLIIIDESLYSELINKLPECFAVLRNEKWQKTEHAFFHNHYQKKVPFYYKEKEKEFTNSFEIVESFNNYFIEKSWAEEIAWRLNREHELRMAEGEKIKLKEKYRKGIQELLPVSLENIINRINDKIDIISSIAFPSVIESLISGIPVIKNKRKDRQENTEVLEETTLSSGFSEEHLLSRRTILKYQHRMHPEISEFPRKNFYNQNALKDPEFPSIKDKRNWSYNRYKYRSIWLDVNGKTTKNYNNDEVKALIKHLRYFVEYAKNNEQPEGKVWSVACLTFYKGQEHHLREELQKLTKNQNAYSNFYVLDGKYKINIKLHTVDKFQGQEADIVFLSMVQTKRDGFLDNPNRLNVSITRAKFQLVIIGNYQYFANRSKSEDLRNLALFHKERLLNESEV